MKNNFICTRCGEEHAEELIYYVGENVLCEACAEEGTVLCEHCGTRLYRQDCAGDEWHTLCVRCLEDYYQICQDCDAIISNEETRYDSDDTPYCERCYDEYHRGGVIEDYSYKPAPIFYGEGNRFFGVELEIDGGGQDDECAQAFLDIANADAERLYIKSDGSLDDGMELVTHPMTPCYHMENMPWERLLKHAVTLGYQSHNTDTCGLHIHISKTAFGPTEPEQEDAISRLLYFTEKFWTELLQFSRRTQSQLNRWAARYGMKLHPKEILDVAKNSCQGRYTAVNLMNEHTAELRIFRGTLKYNTLIAALQMANAICDAAIFCSDKELQDLSWHDFLGRIQQKELIQYLKERNLYKNEPINETEVA